MDNRNSTEEEKKVIGTASHSSTFTKPIEEAYTDLEIAGKKPNALTKAALNRPQIPIFEIKPEGLPDFESYYQESICYILLKDNLPLSRPPISVLDDLAEEFKPVSDYFSSHRALEADKVANYFGSSVNNALFSAYLIAITLLRDPKMTFTGEKMPTINAAVPVPDSMKTLACVLSVLRTHCQELSEKLDRRLKESKEGWGVLEYAEQLMFFSEIVEEYVLHILELAEYLSPIQDIIQIAAEKSGIKSNISLIEVFMVVFARCCFPSIALDLSTNYIEGFTMLRKAAIKYGINSDVKDVMDHFKKALANMIDTCIGINSISRINDSRFHLTKELSQLAKAITESSIGFYFSVIDEYKTDEKTALSIIQQDCEMLKDTLVPSIYLDSFTELSDLSKAATDRDEMIEAEALDLVEKCGELGSCYVRQVKAEDLSLETYNKQMGIVPDKSE